MVRCLAVVAVLASMSAVGSFAGSIWTMGPGMASEKWGNTGLLFVCIAFLSAVVAGALSDLED